MALHPNELEQDVFYADSNEFTRAKIIKDYLYGTGLFATSTKEDGYYGPYVEDDVLTYDGHKRPFLDYKIKRLEIGDYAWNDVGIEYKTVTDCEMSIQNVTLTRQCIDLINHYKYPGLVVTGDKSKIKDENTKRLQQYEMGLHQLSSSLPVYQPLTNGIAYQTIIRIITTHDDNFGIPRKFYDRCHNPAINTMHSMTRWGWNRCKKICLEHNMTCPDHVNTYLQSKSLQKYHGKNVTGVGPKLEHQAKSIYYGKPTWDVNNENMG